MSTKTAPVEIQASDTLTLKLNESEISLLGAPCERATVSRNQARYEFDRWLDTSKKTKSGRAERTMVFDRDGDQHDGTPWYDETVTDPETGKTITDDKHYPLHSKPPSGSAKR